MTNNASIKQRIKEEYGSQSNYCREYGDRQGRFNPKTFYNIIRRDLKSMSLENFDKYFGPLNIDINHFLMTEEALEYQVREPMVFEFKEGRPLADFQPVESRRSCDFIVRRAIDSELLYCKFCDGLEPTETGIFLRRGSVCIGELGTEDGQDVLYTATGKEVLYKSEFLGLQLIGKVI